LRERFPVVILIFGRHRDKLVVHQLETRDLWAVLGQVSPSPVIALRA
jgi:hypothetical protein